MLLSGMKMAENAVPPGGSSIRGGSIDDLYFKSSPPIVPLGAMVYSRKARA